MPPTVNRRKFLQFAAAVPLAAPSVTPLFPDKAVSKPPPGKIPLGFDNFAVRAMKWKAPQLIDYAASLSVDCLMLSDLDVYESHDPAYLSDVRARAEKAGIKIHAGTGSICPTSKSFNPKHGTAVEHATLVIKVAAAVGSPVARCYLGNGGDRVGDEGIMPHIEETVKVCKSVRDYALEMGVKLAVENHAGDMQAWELAGLVEMAGRDHVGVSMDAGNASWTLEDPAGSFEILAPYAVTTSMRDSVVWEDERGLQVQWVNVGQGMVDWKAYAETFRTRCPGLPFVIETISGGPRGFPTLDPKFWEPWPRARAADFAKFIAMAKRGKPYEQPADRPATASTPGELEQLQQKWDLEQSLKYCRETLGMGLV